MKKVLFIIGSLRKDSYNRQLALIAEKKLEGKAEVKELDFKALPFFNQDEEYPASPIVEEIRKEVKEADLLVFSTPEYNHSIPGQVKNLVDTLSRPVVPGDTESAVIKGKKAVLLGASGRSAAQYSRETLKDLLTFVGAEVFPTEFGHALVKDEWIRGKLVLSEEEDKTLASLLNAALEF